MYADADADTKWSSITQIFLRHLFRAAVLGARLHQLKVEAFVRAVSLLVTMSSERVECSSGMRMAAMKLWHRVEVLVRKKLQQQQLHYCSSLVHAFQSQFVFHHATSTQDILEKLHIVLI